MSGEPGRTVAIVPTYEEAENIDAFLRAFRAANPDVDVLVVDDTSPDGTAQLARTTGEEVGRVEVLVKPTKDGLGAAYRHGMRHALAEGYSFIGQIDADFSHDPAAFPGLRAAMDAGAADHVGLVIGSRYVPGGSIPNWPVHRRLLSKWGNVYTRLVLGMQVADGTAGFRLWRADAIEATGLLDAHARGYLFQIENAYRATRAGIALREVPIAFADRVRGTSKMNGTIIVEALGKATWWGFRDRVLRRGGAAPASGAAS
jgi:dolichol-phosphate mannosyltransferase